MYLIYKKKEQILREIRACLDNELYIAALSMLMMDPDIFCTMEKGNEANVRNKKII